MNIRSLRPNSGGEFDVESPQSALASEPRQRQKHSEDFEREQSALYHDQGDVAQVQSAMPKAETLPRQRESAAKDGAAQTTQQQSFGDAGESESSEDANAEDEESERALSQSKRDYAFNERLEDQNEFEPLFRQWKATGDPRLRERLILMHRNMVMFLARRFMDRGELFEDVMQVGMLGLIYALDGYDLERGVKFSTFAIPTISGEIRRYFRDKVAGMRVPRGLQELHNTLQNKIEELTQQLDRSPTYAEIAFSLKIEVEQVVEALELGSVVEPLSIDDRYFGEESATIAESIGAPDPQLHAYEEHAELQAALEKLPAQERRILELSYFEGHSQAEIARRMNVSQMHISRLLRRSLGQLKQLLEEV